MKNRAELLCRTLILYIACYHRVSKLLNNITARPRALKGLYLTRNRNVRWNGLIIIFDRAVIQKISKSLLLPKIASITVPPRPDIASFMGIRGPNSTIGIGPCGSKIGGRFARTAPDPGLRTGAKGVTVCARR